jgi:peptide/nickel transport system substrate-binding protein
VEAIPMEMSKSAGWTASVRRRSLLGGLAGTTLCAPALAQRNAGSTLKFVPQAGLTILDPTFSTTSVTSTHGNYVFETLYGVDSKLRPQPQMAAGHEILDDGRRYIITLREGLRFHDGSPVRAADCAASLRRWAARDVFGRDVAAVVDAWEPLDDRRLQIRLKAPFPLLLLALAKPSAPTPFIMPERLAASDPAKPITEMIGSGPYCFVADEFVSSSRVVYRKFDGYIPRSETSDWAAGGKIAHFDRIEWHVMPDASTAASALQTGEVDWWEQAHADLLPLLRRNKDIVVDVADPTGYLPILRFNSTIPPFDRPEIRRAVLLAIDQANYLSAITGSDSEAWRICHSVFPCGTAYGHPSSPNPMKAADIGIAKRALQNAGYAGEKIVILNPSDFPTLSPLGAITYDLLKQMGANVDLVESDWGTVISRSQSREPVERGGWNIYHTWYTGLNLALPPQNAPIRGLGNRGWTGWYESAAMEQLNADWLRADSDEARAQIATKMQHLAFADVPSIYLGQFFMRTAYRKTLTGIAPSPKAFPWGVRRN